jgi:hypothetical protein
MTRYEFNETGLTRTLVAFVSRGVSWLRHRGGAGELDWALLHGATAEELQDIRGGWRNHIDHLYEVHSVVVEENPHGFFRIVGAESPAGSADAPPDNGPDDDSDEDGAVVLAQPGGDAAARAGAEQATTRIHHTAVAMMALHAAGELRNPMHKDAVGMLIRQASECNRWHNSAHFRSLAAEALINAANVRTPAQYQAFCKSNLRHEHMVQNVVLYRMIVDNPAPTHEWLVDVFVRFSRRATITREEDRLLLATDMPPGFYEAGHPWFNDPMARYRQANLEDSLRPRPGAMWVPDTRSH